MFNMKNVFCWVFFVLKKIMLLNAKHLKNRKQRNHILDASKVQSGINKVHKKKKKLILQTATTDIFAHFKMTR